MASDKDSDAYWRKLCIAASKEKDADKLVKLVAEIIEIGTRRVRRMLREREEQPK
jgi:hypothetical protein